MKITSFERLFRSYSPIYLGKIAINWHISNNFGDALSIYLAKKLSGLDTLNTDENPDIQHYQVTGSILSLANKNSLVWGTGFVNKKLSFIYRPKKIFMVRGEYSLERCRQLGVRGDIVLGDPGYVISRLYKPQDTPKTYKLGVIPHWIDYNFCKLLFHNREDIAVIDLLNPDVESIIDKIISCEKCISSSLHGLVVSHSFDIPCMHVTFSDHKINSGSIKFSIPGDGIKYLDYFSSVKIKEYLPRKISHLEDLDEIIDSIPKDCGEKNQIDRMIDICPFLNLKR